MGKIRKRKTGIPSFYGNGGRVMPVGVLFGEGKRVRLWGLSLVHCLTVSEMNFYYQDWRKNRRRALIMLDGMKEPVRLKGKR